MKLEIDKKLVKREDIIYLKLYESIDGVILSARSEQFNCKDAILQITNDGRLYKFGHIDCRLGFQLTPIGKLEEK